MYWTQLTTMHWAHVGPSVIAAFLASLVEFIEAMTVVLAVGAVRGWRGALTGSGLALLVLLVLVAVLGPALTRIPLEIVQLGVGTLLLLFGMRWLRKAILRAAGAIPLHDEVASYARQQQALRQLDGATRDWDSVAIATAFKITMVEGMEVVFIVIAVGAAGQGLLGPASAGALAALLVVVLLGVALHRPVASIPENALKFIVGLLLASFGTFWVGEGIGLHWPDSDWSLLALFAGYVVLTLLTVRSCQRYISRRVEALKGGSCRRARTDRPVHRRRSVCGVDRLLACGPRACTARVRSWDGGSVRGTVPWAWTDSGRELHTPGAPLCPKHVQPRRWRAAAGGAPAAALMVAAL